MVFPTTQNSPWRTFLGLIFTLDDRVFHRTTAKKPSNPTKCSYHPPQGRSWLWCLRCLGTTSKSPELEKSTTKNPAIFFNIVFHMKNWHTVDLFSSGLFLHKHYSQKHVNLSTKESNNGLFAHKIAVKCGLFYVQSSIVDLFVVQNKNQVWTF